MRVAILAACAALAGCGAHVALPPPAVELRTVEVKVPVPVPCVTADQIAAEPAKVASQLTNDAPHDLDIVAASARRLRAWGETLRATLIACTKAKAG